MVSTKISDLVAIIAHAKAALGPDSGPGHIAALLGVPYVALFGATDAKITAPYKSRIMYLMLNCRVRRATLESVQAWEPCVCA